MALTTVIKSLDIEIARLQEIRAALAGTSAPTASRRGRPKGSTNKIKPVVKAKTVKRMMSPAGKARIAAAQKLRWAKQKAKQTAPKTAKSAGTKSEQAEATPKVAAVKPAPQRTKSAGKKA